MHAPASGIFRETIMPTHQHPPHGPDDEPPKPIEPEMPLGEPPVKPEGDSAVEDVRPDQTRF